MNLEGVSGKFNRFGLISSENDLFDQMSIFPRETVTWGTLAELNFYRR